MIKSLKKWLVAEDWNVLDEDIKQVPQPTCRDRIVREINITDNKKGDPE